MSSEGEQCEAKYGLLPCSTELGPSLFLMTVYGYCLLGGANLLSDGSELLLEILNPGLIGGLVLPILGALPDSLIILFSGLNGKKAAEAVAVGVGTLAGSTVMLLTIAWGGGLLLGRCDLENGVARDRTLTRPFSLVSTGVTTDAAARGNSIIMIATTSLYFLVQGPAWLGHDSPKAAMLGGSLCFLVLAMYCCYMVVVPELQKRKIAAARQRLQRQVALHHFIQAGSSYGGMLNEDHEVNREVVDVIFDQIDDDGNQVIDKQELRGLILGLDVGLNTDVSHLEADMQAWMREFDMDRGGTISRDEFFCIIKRWVGERMEGQKLRISSADDSVHSPSGDVESSSAASPLVPEGEDDGEEDDDGFEDNGWKLMSNAQILRRSLAMLVAGTAICAFFSDPMVEAVSNFATASKLPTFIVAFVITPFASNASELVSSLRFAMRKRSRNISLTFSQVYGAVTMNNTMCLGLFFFVVGLNKLPWNYGPQVVTTAGSTLLIGLLGSSSRTFRTYWGFIALLVYPLAIGAMHLLELHTNLAA